jgi:hypothetical protein
MAAPALLGATLVVSTIAATADVAHADESVTSFSSLEQVTAYSADDAAALDQVTSVSQLTDVRPTDWAFQALQSLVERYGCIVGYPDRTYRGNRALSRSEFAAGVNACLDRINELITAATSDLVRKEDLLALQRLQEEFAAELAVLRGRVDALEVRTATLERQQFSTTTKLSGEVIFALADTFGDRALLNGSGGFLPNVNLGNVDRLSDDQTEPIFGNRVRLTLNTSFSGRDRLRTRLNAGNIPSFGANFTDFAGRINNYTGTNMTRLGFDGDTGNAVSIDKVNYRFPIGDNFQIQVDAVNNEFTGDGLITTLSPFESSGNGALSRFGRYNPIFRTGNPGLPGSAGVTAQFNFSKEFYIQAGYTGDTASNNPAAKNGLFNGSYGAIAQVVYNGPTFGAGLTYARSYFPGGGVNLTGSTGSGFAAQPFTNAFATSSNAVSAQLQFKVSPSFLIGGWFGATFADQAVGPDNSATILNGMAFLAFPDLGKKGNLAGIMVGVPPKVTRNDIAARRDNDTTIHIEGLYRYRLADNIYITPGVIVLINPEHNSDNATQFVGTLRTTFTF